MELAGIVVRVVVSYITLLTLVRLSGRLSVKHATTFDFVVALIAGDLIDNAVWAEVPFLQFVAASVSLFATHAAMRYLGYRAASNQS